MESDSVFVPISLEYLMTYLFGKQNYHGYVGVVSKAIWKLGGYRTICYMQTDAQKTHLLLNRIDTKKQYKIELGDYRYLREVFYHEFKCKASEFITWFKSEHPEIYCSIF